MRADQPAGPGGAALVHIDLSRKRAQIGAQHPLTWIIWWWKDVPVGQGEVRAEPGETLDLDVLAQEHVDPVCLKEAQARENISGANLTATLVICTRDRPDALQRCLASLPEQTVQPHAVIVVDNASCGEQTRQVAEAFGVTYVREDRPGLDIARNTGALLAQSDVVAYTDDDVVLHPQWVERMVGAFASKVDAVSGLVLPGSLRTPAELHFERHWGFGKGFRRKLFGTEFFARDAVDGCPAWEVGAGASMAFRAAVFQQVGLFDERLDVGAAGCSGDSEYWHRLLSQGRVCLYDPAIVAFHFHRSDEAGLRRQLRAYARGHAAALLVQYERTGNRGNLQRVFAGLPRWFLHRAIRRRRFSHGFNNFLASEIAGHLAGIVFYARARLLNRHSAGEAARRDEKRA